MNEVLATAVVDLQTFFTFVETDMQCRLLRLFLFLPYCE